MGPRRPRLRTLIAELAHRQPRLEDPGALIAGGEILVNGFSRINPASLVSASDAITVRGQSRLRGAAKLEHALSAFDVDVQGQVGVDVGAAAGGFTQVLLRAGAVRVYAVDAGHGQLRGGLRQDPRVVNLERTNLGQLNTRLVPEPVGVVTIDVSYLSIAAAVPQLAVLHLAPGADLIALVKPVYELGLATLPEDRHVIATAVRHAADGVSTAGWVVKASERSPVRGTRGGDRVAAPRPTTTMRLRRALPPATTSPRRDPA
jgi:23S rRNA (cytidine1920-2'-O)/16S rRNA (cytidine1409-2'-O)-methyltransferase